MEKKNSSNRPCKAEFGGLAAGTPYEEEISEATYW